MITAIQKVALQDYFDECRGCYVLSPGIRNSQWRVGVARYDVKSCRCDTQIIGQAETRWEALAQAKNWLDKNPKPDIQVMSSAKFVPATVQMSKGHILTSVEGGVK